MHIFFCKNFAVKIVKNFVVKVFEQIGQRLTINSTLLKSMSYFSVTECSIQIKPRIVDLAKHFNEYLKILSQSSLQ